MSDRAFVDTNVFVYLYSEDEEEKQHQAISALEYYDCVSSTQVLNEFCNVCLKKMRMPEDVVSLSIDEIAEECEISLIDSDIIKEALFLVNTDILTMILLYWLLLLLVVVSIY